MDKEKSNLLFAAGVTGVVSFFGIVVIRCLVAQYSRHLRERVFFSKALPLVLKDGKVTTQ